MNAIGTVGKVTVVLPKLLSVGAKDNNRGETLQSHAALRKFAVLFFSSGVCGFHTWEIEFYDN